VSAEPSPFAIYETSAPPGVPVLDVDPFCAEYFDDPYPAQEQMRESGPYFWLSKYGIGAVARYDLVRDVLLDWKTFCSSRGVGMEDFTRHGRFRLRSLILEADPPEHDVSRRVLSQALSASVLRELRGPFERQAQRLVDELVARRNFDGIRDLAQAYPLSVFPDAIGIREEGREKLLPHADALFNSFGPRNEFFQASRTKANFEWIEEQGRRENLRPGGIGMLVHAAAERGEISEESATMLVRALLQAGLDTTVNSLAAALHALATFPQEWEKLRSDPGLAKSAFEEAIRFESPVQTFFRTAARSVQLGGTSVNSGAKVLLFLGAANRDGRKWDAPATYKITRRQTGHVGFGAGIHGCVGQLLAKMEGEILLSELARRVSTIRLAEAPTRHYNNTIRGWSCMPLSVEPI
jgi:4-methoxybenzoate monooxygenase (O-demethylating)